MIIHHVATMFLLYFSWIINFPNIGCIVLLLHDAADPALAVSTCIVTVTVKLLTHMAAKHLVLNK